MSEATVLNMPLQEIEEFDFKFACQTGNVTIGLTGGIGSGKSIVSRILRCQGFPVYDCDKEAKQLMVKNPEVVEDLKKAVGQHVFKRNGELNKEYLSKRLFSEHHLRRQVNAIVHSAVKNDIELKRDNIKGLFFIESAILKSSHIDELCDKIWIVEASPKERIERVLKRDNLSKGDIIKRMESQRKEYEGFEEFRTSILINNNCNPLLIPVLELLEGSLPDPHRDFLVLNSQP